MSVFSLNENFDKLVEKLKELFQINRGDLDFGLYRVMRIKSADVAKFLENDLLSQVKESLGEFAGARADALATKIKPKRGQH